MVKTVLEKEVPKLDRSVVRELSHEAVADQNTNICLRLDLD